MKRCSVPVSVYVSLNLSWCRAMVFPLKTSSTVVFANRSPSLNMLLRMALTFWCAIMKQSYARFLAPTPMPSKCLIVLVLVLVPVIMWFHYWLRYQVLLMCFIGEDKAHIQTGWKDQCALVDITLIIFDETFTTVLCFMLMQAAAAGVNWSI